MPPESSLRFLVARRGEVHHGDVLLDVFPALFRRPGREDFIHGQRDVLVNTQPREQGVVLKDDGAVGRGFDDRFAAEQHRPGIRRLQSGDERHERGLARAGVADNGHEFAFVDVQINVAQHFGPLAAEAVTFADVVEF
jgi:hypothetical protein